MRRPGEEREESRVPGEDLSKVYSGRPADEGSIVPFSLLLTRVLEQR